MTTQSHILVPSPDETPTTIVHADDPLSGPTWSLSLNSEHTWSIHMPSPDFLRKLAQMAGQLADTVEGLQAAELGAVR
jgi:hypothetical protein